MGLQATVETAPLRAAIRAASLASGKNNPDIYISAEPSGVVRIFGTNGHWAAIYKFNAGTLNTTTPTPFQSLQMSAASVKLFLKKSSNAPLSTSIDFEAQQVVSGSLTIACSTSGRHLLEILDSHIARPPCLLNKPLVRLDHAYLGDIIKAFKGITTEKALVFDFLDLDVVRITPNSEQGTDCPLTVLLMPLITQEDKVFNKNAEATSLEGKLKKFSVKAAEIRKDMSSELEMTEKLAIATNLSREAGLLKEILLATMLGIEEKATEVANAVRAVLE